MLDITTLAAWGEFLGGIAVVVSLVYLAVQIRSNTKTVRASSYSEMLTGTHEFSTMTVDPETATLYLRGLSDFEGLDSADQVRFNSLMSHVTAPVNQALNLRKHGRIDDAMFEHQAKVLSIIFENPGVGQWWEANQKWWPPDFREFVRQATAA